MLRRLVTVFMFPRASRLLFALSLAALFAGFPGRTTAHASAVMLLGYPTFKQQHHLTCESSAASMGTRGIITESQLMAIIPRRANPNLGFRGNPDGLQGTQLIDYGVYAAPVQKALAAYGYESAVLYYSNDSQLVSYISQGWPVVVWITYALQRAAPRVSWANGEPFFLVPHEHAVLAVGYTGNAIIVNDPYLARRVAYGWGDFNRGWGYFDNMALAIEPCPTPSPVATIKLVSASASRVTWTWSKSANAASYQVTVVQRGTPDKAVFHGSQTTRRVSVRNPSPGATYTIRISAVSACGTSSDPAVLWTQMPASFPTPVTPRPTASPTPVPPKTTPGTPSPTPVTGTSTTPAPEPTATAKVTAAP
jgi:uncharacterized protein YvpB